MSFLDQARYNLSKPFQRSSGSKDTRIVNASAPSAANRQSQQVNHSARRYSATGWDVAPKPKLKAKQQEELPSPISDLSTPPVPNSLWFAQDIQLAASVVIIQPSTSRYIVLSEKRMYKTPEGKDQVFETWFLPRGRKDVGESLEQTAVREGYEESGYRCTLMPLDIPTRATRPTNAQKKAIRSRCPNCEPIYIQVLHNPPAQAYLHPSQPGRGGTEYICFYYVAEIPPDAVPEEGTKMKDEQGYVTHLLPLEEALHKLKHSGDMDQYFVVRLASDIWTATKKSKIEKKRREREKVEGVTELVGSGDASGSGNLERADSREKKASEKRREGPNRFSFMPSDSAE